jgi:hypothetical protein
MERCPEIYRSYYSGYIYTGQLVLSHHSIIHQPLCFGIYFALLSPSYAPERPNPKCLIIFVYPFIPALPPSRSRILTILEREFDWALTFLSLRPLPNPLLRPKALIPPILIPATVFLSEHHMVRPNSAFLVIAFIAFPLYLQAFLIVLALFDARLVGVDVAFGVAESLVIPLVELGGD